ncbi:MAG: ATP-binding protein [Myxococcota bacterium]
MFKNRICKIAVVDDEEGIRLGSKSILEAFEVKVDEDKESLNFQIDEFSDKNSFVNNLEKEDDPDLVLLDCKLPDGNGIDILEEYLSDKDDIIVIIITAYATVENAVKTTKRGAFDFLAKPFTPDQLRHSVRKAVNHLYLKRKAAQLEKKQKSIRFEFLSVLAHELKSPINAVEGYLDLMENEILGDKINKYSKIIGNCTDRIGGMRKLIMDLLDLTRIESGQKKREVTRIDAAAILRKAMANFKLSAEKNKVELEIKAPDKLEINGDEGELMIIYNNLISNAIKYNRENGRVTAKLSKSEQGMEIEVEDTGIGLKEEDQKRLFQEFTRIKNEKTRNIQGSGLGLSIVRKITDLYQGTIEVNSKYGKGTVLKIKLNSSY